MWFPPEAVLAMISAASVASFVFGVVFDRYLRTKSKVEVTDALLRCRKSPVGVHVIRIQTGNCIYCGVHNPPIPEVDDNELER